MRRNAFVGAIVVGLGTFGSGAFVQSGPARVGPTGVDLQLIKTASPVAAEPGDRIVYTYTLTNTGSEPLSDLTLSDDKLGEVPLPADVLAPGESVTVTASYVARADEAGSTIVNLATAVASGPVEPPVSAPGATPGSATAVKATASAAVPVDPAPAAPVPAGGVLPLTG